MSKRGITRLRSKSRALIPIVYEKTNSDDLAQAGLRKTITKRLFPKQGKRGSFTPEGDAQKKFI